MKDLRKKTIRAGVANVSGQAVSFFLRIVSLMILGRLLGPADYGLVGMVTAFTGVLSLFSGLGLFQAAIQRETMPTELASTLFWVNLALGATLTLCAIAIAPAVGAFYHEPRLLAVTSVVAIGFIVTGAGIQHAALLQRQMRFGASAVIDVVAVLAGTSIAVTMAVAGYGYWALVSMTITIPVVTTIGVWLATGWIPGMPRKGVGIRSMIHFGGTMTLNGFVAYFTNNFDKLVLGRWWGVEAIGIYGRAFHLVNYPPDILNTTIGEVAFAALSRTKGDPDRLRRYFLKGYSLVVALTLPMTVACAIFADDLIMIVLGPKWMEAAGVFRILAPTIMVFAISNPLGWLLSALGLVERGLKIALVSAPLMIAGILIGLPYGPKGVAIAYSTVMLLKVVPTAAWALHGTGIRVAEICSAMGRPLVSSLVAAGAICGAHALYGPMLPLVPRFIVDVAAFGAIYVGVLLFAAGQKSFYLDILRASTAAPSC